MYLFYVYLISWIHLILKLKPLNNSQIFGIFIYSSIILILIVRYLVFSNNYKTILKNVHFKIYAFHDEWTRLCLLTGYSRNFQKMQSISCLSICIIAFDVLLSPLFARLCMRPLEFDASFVIRLLEKLAVFHIWLVAISHIFIMLLWSSLIAKHNSGSCKISLGKS